MPDKDTLTFTLRIHDAAEKQDPAKSTAWSVVEIPREDLTLAAADFVAKYVAPALVKLEPILTLK